MVGQICDHYVLPHLADITVEFEAVKKQAADAINAFLDRDIFHRDKKQDRRGFLDFKAKSTAVNDDKTLPEIGALAAWRAALPNQKDPQNVPIYRP